MAVGREWCSACSTRPEIRIHERTDRNMVKYLISGIPEAATYTASETSVSYAEDVDFIPQV